MTIESQLAALTAQTQALDATITTELADVNTDVSTIRTRVTALEIGAGPSTSGGTGGAQTGGTTGVEVVTSLPTTENYEGRTVLLGTKLHVWNGTAWTEVTSTSTSEAPPGVLVVSSLPTTGTEGDVIFNRTDSYLYQRVNGVWVQVVVQVNTSTTVADASLTVAKFAAGLRPVEILDTLPTAGNVAGRLVFLTTDNKLYRYNGTAFVNKIGTEDLTGTIGADQIAANAITTGKIQAGAVTASQIAADAVNAGKIAAGSITADKIVANAVTADKIASNSITSAKIEANAITAGKIAAGVITSGEIAAGAVTVGKLSSSSSPETIIAGLSFGLGQAEANSGWTSAGYFRTTNGSYAGALGISTAAGIPAVVGIASASGGYGGGFYNYSGSTKLTQFVGGAGSYAAVAQHISSNKTITLANSSYAAYVGGGGGKIYAVDGVGPFTGVHDGVTPDTPALGDIMVDHQILAHESISSSIASFKLSSQANQKGVIGACSEVFDSPPAGWRPEDPIFGQASASQNPSVPSGHRVVHVNALGEGLINVCGENGNIEKGDLIVTSSTPGKGMKQSDDLVRGCTVAKAREAVSFSSPTEIKQVACIYLAG